MDKNMFGDKYTLAQITTWCPRPTRDYLFQYWPRFMSSCGITRPQGVNVYDIAELQITTKTCILDVYIS